jgi:predicted AlkP superfamily phosphohydrolase/phosphomutase
MLRRIPATLLLLVLVGCSGSDEPDLHADLPSFPPEPSRADFPGVSYPELRGEIPLPGSLTGPVWLIGIDGATWDLIGPLVERGELPTLGSMMNSGAHGVLLSEDPTISPALWATIATGMPRFEHGIVNFLVKLPGSRDTVQAGPLDRRSPAVWEMVGAAGGRSLVVGWFGSYPAETIAGVYVSKGYDPQRPGENQIHPPSAAETLREQARAVLREEDREAIARSDFLRDTLLEDARALAVFRTLAAADPPPFAALYLAGTDVVQHVTWRHMDPDSQQFPQDGEPDPRLAGVIPAYYRFVDHALGQLRRLAPKGTTLVVVSDHGAGPMQPAEAYHFQLEVLLEQLGLMREEGGQAFAIGELYRNVKRIWLDGVPPGAAAGEAAAIRERLEALRTDDGREVFAAVTDHTSDPGWDAERPALTVRFSSAALVTARVRDGDRELDFSPVRLRHADVSGAHRREGILLLQGPGIRPGPLAEPATLYRIAPTLLYLLGLPQDQRMLRLAPERGGVLKEVIDPALLERFPVAMIPEYPGTDREGLLRSRDRDEQADPAREDAMERLRSLGYIR